MAQQVRKFFSLTTFALSKNACSCVLTAVKLSDDTADFPSNCKTGKRSRETLVNVLVYTNCEMRKSPRFLVVPDTAWPGHRVSYVPISLIHRAKL